MKYLAVTLLVLLTLSGCSNSSSNHYADVQIAGAMRNVMWNGELDGKLSLDTIAKSNVYGLGPLSGLKGELLVKNGLAYVAKVTSDSSMQVFQDTNVSAPFFVYAEVKEWRKTALPNSITDQQSLDNYLNEQTANYKRPFAFMLKGTIESATIHLQNLPEGTEVSSPEEAHQGQINYQLRNREVEILGFFSTNHKGVFTHHDSNIHLHLLTTDEQMMGHVDEIEFAEMQLFLPLR